MVRKQVIENLQIVLSIGAMLLILIGMVCGMKYMNQPYIQLCEQYTQSDYQHNNIPVRCDGYWRLK